MTTPASDIAHARAVALHAQAYGATWERHVADALALIERDTRKAEHLGAAMRRIDGEES